MPTWLQLLGTKSKQIKALYTATKPGKSVPCEVITFADSSYNGRRQVDKATSWVITYNGGSDAIYRLLVISLLLPWRSVDAENKKNCFVLFIANQCITRFLIWIALFIFRQMFLWK